MPARDYDKGLAAYSAGDYTTALQEWRRLAKWSQAVAQFGLDVMYAKGQGAPQDYAEDCLGWSWTSKTPPVDCDVNYKRLFFEEPYIRL